MTMYYELPRVYIGKLAVDKQVGDGLWESQDTSYFVVDKKSLRGTFFRIVNDFMEVCRTGYGHPGLFTTGSIYGSWSLDR